LARVAAEGAEAVQRRIEGTLTKEQVEAFQKRERRLFGDGGDVRRELPRLRADVEQETYRRLLPGYVRRFIEKAAPFLDIGIEGDLDAIFSLQARKPGALDPLWPIIESYSPEQRSCLTVLKPNDKGETIFLHPGELLFDRFRAYACSRFARDALKGGVFVDPTSKRPYMFHLALLTVSRKADPAPRAFAHDEILEYHLVGLKQQEAGQVEECPVEHLLLLKGGHGVPAETIGFAATAKDSCELSKAYVIERIARPHADRRRQALLGTLPEREDFVRRGYDYQDAELAAARARLVEKARTGDPRASGELTRIKERQRVLMARREDALALLRREPELISPGDVTFLAHALVMPSSDAED